MSTDKLTGNFTYSSLKQTIKNKGIVGQNLSEALKKIAAANGIDDITKIDGSQKITVGESIFEKYASQNQDLSTSDNSDILKSYSASFLDAFNTNKVLSTDLNSLPEIFNDDDYDVMDYDDYYDFQNNLNPSSGEEVSSENKADKANSEDKGLDFEAFSEKYGNIFSDSSNLNSDTQLKQIFNAFDKNSNSYLDNSELKKMNLHGFSTTKEDKQENIPDKEGEGQMMPDMETDMSGDSFNPQ